MRTPYTVGLGLLIAGVVSAQQQSQTRIARRTVLYADHRSQAVRPAKESWCRRRLRKRRYRKPSNRSRRTLRKSQPSLCIRSKKSMTTLPEGVRVQNTSTHGEEVVGPPLALKYRLLKGSPMADMTKWILIRYSSPATRFGSPSSPMILVNSRNIRRKQQSSSKTCNLLFPNAGHELAQQPHSTES